ncbi:MAG: hypothetical protein KKA42_16580, partial [candidate division Zixibacteria bacterium]|nr:hypothetical protein [candidate division Zixibacteria bacterium]
MRVYVVATIRMLIIIMAIVTYAGGTSYAQPSPLQVVLPLVDADPGQEPDSMATVNLDLFGSIVCGFDIWFSADRDDIARFTTETIIVFDTAYWKCNVADGQFCLDSTEVGWYDDWDYITIDPMERTGVVFDTVGTLLSGWEIVRVTSPSGDGSDVRIVAVADDLETPGTVSCILPTSYAPLIHLGSRALMVPDTQAVRSTYLNLPMDAAHCRFWNEHGTYIGGLPEVTPDT